MLSREDILAIQDVAIQKVSVPEWGGDVYVRGARLEDSAFFDSLKADEDKTASQKMLVRFVCNEKGEPIFTEADVAALEKKSLKVFTRLMEVINSLNSVETAEKN